MVDKATDYKVDASAGGVKKWQLPPASNSIDLRRILEVAPLALGLLIGAVWLYSSRGLAALLIYAIAVIFAMGIVLARLRVLIPHGRAAVVERSGVPMVEWGPQTLTRWPVIERIKAIVPLFPLPLRTEKQVIKLSPTESVELELVIHYGPDVEPDDDETRSDNVCRSIYCVKDPCAGNGGKVSSSQNGGYQTETEVQKVWEQRLKLDILPALNASLRSQTYDNLLKDQPACADSIHRRLESELQNRVGLWGMRIYDASILNPTRPSDVTK